MDPSGKWSNEFEGRDFSQRAALSQIPVSCDRKLFYHWMQVFVQQRWFSCSSAICYVCSVQYTVVFSKKAVFHAKLPTQVVFFFLIFHEKCYKSLRTVPTGVYVVETLLYLISTHAEETLESCFVNLYQHCFSLFCHTELTHGR